MSLPNELTNAMDSGKNNANYNNKRQPWTPKPTNVSNAGVGTVQPVAQPNIGPAPFVSQPIVGISPAIGSAMGGVSAGDLFS